MKNVYDYMFYRLYLWNLNQWGEKDNPDNNATLGVSFIQSLNILTVILIIVRMEIFNSSLLSDIRIALTIGVSTFAFNYFRYYYKKRYLKFIKRYKKENEDKSRKNLLFLIIFSIMSFLVPGIIAFL